MSRFTLLKKSLGFIKGWLVYRKIKANNLDAIQLPFLKHPFSMRNNPFDYATFEEVLLRREYDIQVGFNPVNIVDCGANIGLTAVFFANRFPKSHIVAIEPDLENFGLLETNTKSYKNISVVHSGVWESDKYLSVVDNGMGNNAFTVKEVPENTPSAFKAVSITTIMSQKGWDTIDILKMDVEGSEKNIFENNYQAWLPKVKILIIELHDNMITGASKAVFKAVSQYDFAFEIRGENIVFRNLSM